MLKKFLDGDVGAITHAYIFPSKAELLSGSRFSTLATKPK